jgi:hypothetical protein
MATTQQTQYLSFDAPTVKQLIVDRLNEIGAFTDQNYEGSNISSLIEIFAYTYQSLLFYLNRTSTNTLFSDTNVYENINRLVKIIDYKPIGNQTSTLTFAASAQATLTQGGYVIPRYTFFRLGNVIYSFNTDITFTKTTSALEFLSDMSNQNLLYQGKYIEYPVYTAVGSENETLVLAPGDDVIIDHFNIDVYVKDVATGKWSQWVAVPTLFFENKDSKSVEIRLNENKRYEIKFGNNINGKQLNTGDVVAVYYLESKGTDGEVGIGAINNKLATPYNTIQFNAIMTDIYEGSTDLMDAGDTAKLSFTNDTISTKYDIAESVDSVRANAPKIFRSQFRLVTLDDYEAYIRANFSNIIRDVKLTNNWGYLTEYIKYLHSIGLSAPNRDSRVFFNQLAFADACNFNNIYAFVVPKIERYVDSVRVNYLTPAQKEAIINSVNTQKTTTAEVVLLDPVYMAVTVGVAGVDEPAALEDKDVSYLSVVPNDNSKVDLTYIKNQIKNILQAYFANNSCTFGQVIDVASINDQILNISGIKKIYTRRTNSTVSTEGISLMVWNPVYPKDIQETTKNLALDQFKFPYFFDIETVINNIVIESSSINGVQAIEY